MNEAEGRIRAATRAVAGTVQEVRPLDLTRDAPREPAAPQRRPRAGVPHRLRPWGVPLAAAAAILAIAATLVAVRDMPRGNPAPGSSSTRPAVPTSTRYYVALNNPHNAASRDQVVVGDTLTGRRLATVSPPKGGTFGGVTGAADDRTFVLDVRQFPWSNTWFAVTPRTWYLLKFAPGSAHPTRLTRLRIPATPSGAQVDGMALSPDGSEFAVMYQPDAMGPAPGPVTLRIYSVATGKAVHTWVGPTPNPKGAGDYLFGQYLHLDDNATLSWTSDGRSLAFVYGAGLSTDTTVRTLNLTSSGEGLLSGSRLVLDLKPGSAPDCSSLLLTAKAGRSSAARPWRPAPARWAAVRPRRVWPDRESPSTRLRRAG